MALKWKHMLAMSEMGLKPKSWRLKVMSALVRTADCSTDRQEGRACRQAFQFRLQGMPVIHPRIAPNGQITESCPAPFAKKFRFALTPNQQYIAHRPIPQRGARAIVTDAGRDAMDTDGAVKTTGA
jgi:hypothetical protein